MNPSLLSYISCVLPEWVDEYGHMNVAYYVLACDQATYAFWEHVNDGRPLAERGGAEYAVVETHVNYLREVRGGDPLRIETQLLGCDAKRFSIFHTMYHAEEGYVAATNEVMSLGFNLNSRALMPFEPEIQQRLRALRDAHREFPTPKNAGRAVRTLSQP